MSRPARDRQRQFKPLIGDYHTLIGDYETLIGDYETLIGNYETLWLEGTMIR